MNTGIEHLQATSCDIRDQLKILSHVVYGAESGSKNNGFTPQKTEVVDSANDAQVQDNNDKGKRKFLAEPNGNIHEVYTSSDEEGEWQGKKICRSLPTKKIEDTLASCKPQLPSAWTHVQILSRGKAPLVHNTSVCRSDFRRMHRTEVMIP